MQYINYNNNSVNLNSSNTKSTINTNTNSTTNTTTNSAIKNIKGFNKDALPKKGQIKQIQINISSTQSPEHKPTYHVEIENCERIDLNSNCTKNKFSKKDLDLPTTKVGSLSSKKFNFNFSEILNNSPQNNHYYRVDFFKQRFGMEKFEKLIELLKYSDNPTDELDNIDAISEIVGDDYKIAQSFLRYLISALNTPSNK